MSFLSELTTASNSARAAKTVEEQSRVASLDRKRARELRVAIQAGEAILEEAYPRMRRAATRGEKRCQIVKLSYSDYSCSNNTLTIKGVTSMKIRHVYEVLDAQGLQPRFEFDHDGGGMESWFHLVVVWP